MYLRREAEAEKGMGDEIARMRENVLFTCIFTKMLLFCLASHAIVESCFKELFVNTKKRVQLNNKKANRLTRKQQKKRHGMSFIFYLSSTNPKNLPKSNRSSSLTQRGSPSESHSSVFDATTHRISACLRLGFQLRSFGAR